MTQSARRLGVLRQALAPREHDTLTLSVSNPAAVAAAAAAAAGPPQAATSPPLAVTLCGHGEASRASLLVSFATPESLGISGLSARRPPHSHVFPRARVERAASAAVGTIAAALVAPRAGCRAA